MLTVVILQLVNLLPRSSDPDLVGSWMPIFEKNEQQDTMAYGIKKLYRLSFFPDGTFQKKIKDVTQGVVKELGGHKYILSFNGVEDQNDLHLTYDKVKVQLILGKVQPARFKRFSKAPVDFLIKKSKLAN